MGFKLSFSTQATARSAGAGERAFDKSLQRRGHRDVFAANEHCRYAGFFARERMDTQLAVFRRPFGYRPRHHGDAEPFANAAKDAVDCAEFELAKCANACL